MKRTLSIMAVSCLALAGCATEETALQPPAATTSGTAADSSPHTPAPAATTSTQSQPAPAPQPDNAGTPRLTPDCDAALDATAYTNIVAAGSLPVMIINGPQDGTVTNLATKEDHYAPCEPLSYAITSGTYQDSPVEFLTLFSHGTTVGTVGGSLAEAGSLDVSVNGTTLTANYHFNGADVTTTFTADEFGNVTAKDGSAEAMGTIRSASLADIPSLKPAYYPDTAFTFGTGASTTATCVATATDLSCRHNEGAWDEVGSAFTYAYGTRDITAGKVKQATSAPVEAEFGHTVFGPPAQNFDVEVLGSNDPALRSAIIHLTNGDSITIDATRAAYHQHP